MLLPLLTFLGMLFGLGEAELVFVGDAMQHKVQLDAAKRNGGWNYEECFRDVAPWFKTADLAVVNLETPIGPAPHTGYPCFNAPEEFADALKDAGFGLFLTANNHTLDRHDRGMRTTIEALDKRKLPHLGTYHDAAARDTLLPHIRNVAGFRIGFLNYTYGTNGIKARQGAVADYIDRRIMAEDIRRTREAGAEMICVCIHWGDEYRMLPNAEQRDLADWLQQQGVEMIIGGHPHVVQPMELREDESGKRCLVAYSLGNFISGMRTRDTRGGAALSVRLERTADGTPRVASAGWLLHFTEPAADGHNFRVVDAYSSKDPRAAAFREAAEKIFEKHNIGVERLPAFRHLAGSL